MCGASGPAAETPQGAEGGRTLTAAILVAAGWIRQITSLDADTWTTTEVLRLYRARWHIALVCKKMKQWLRLRQICSHQRARVEAPGPVLLVAWARHAHTTTWLRTALRATATPETVVVSRWLLSGLGLDTLRQQVQGTWSEARLQACLPHLCRLLCHRLRRRVHQESAVRAWLTQRASLHGGRQPQVA